MIEGFEGRDDGPDVRGTHRQIVGGGHYFRPEGFVEVGAQQDRMDLIHQSLAKALGGFIHFGAACDSGFLLDTRLGEAFKKGLGDILASIIEANATNSLTARLQIGFEAQKHFSVRWR